MRELPRKLTVDELAELFEGRTRFVERLSELEDPLVAADVIREVPEDEMLEALSAPGDRGEEALRTVGARAGPR